MPPGREEPAVSPNQDVALAFVERFCRGRVEDLEALLAPDFTLRGPLGSFDSRDHYLEALKRDPPLPAAWRVVRLLEAGDQVCIFYEIQRANGPLLVAQAFRIADGMLRESLLAFDASGLG